MVKTSRTIEQPPNGPNLWNSCTAFKHFYLRIFWYPTLLWSKILIKTATHFLKRLLVASKCSKPSIFLYSLLTFLIVHLFTPHTLWSNIWIFVKISLHLGTRNESIACKTPELRNFCQGFAGRGPFFLIVGILFY